MSYVVIHWLYHPTKENAMTDTTDTSYNGWKNYETWAMALWIDNERSDYEWSREYANDVRKMEEEDLNGRTRAGVLADALTEYMVMMAPLLEEASVWSDLLHAAISEIDWYEIAENYLSEVDE